MVLSLVLLNICHWIADYTWLSTPWMLAAKRIGRPLLPIFCHAFIHAILMGVVLIILSTENIIFLFLIQVISHFIIDIFKGKINVWFPRVSSPTNVIHWTVFGGDQFLHQLVIIFMAHYATK